MSKSNQSLIELMESRRIALTPEHEGGWHAEVYDDAARPLYEGYGLTIDEAITAALSPDAQPLPYQGIPGTSYQRLNMLANQGE
ncbi:hypothetical protein FGA82_17905 [Pseudomonas fluorescens]|uniref:hypothetical protein n=1 Tax=Pseudomonas fluorescens TaxID=294 RepID=UPI00113265DD|nr:hypothetical protein [Pseudomonas fluorescens]TMU77497.1 hypothetical protein FGA82_17905 [Pseudomonas fluorescens]